MTQEAWVSEDQVPLARVVVHSYDDHGESMVQSFLKNSRLLFQLEQKQTTPVRPNAPTHVTEMRYYYANLGLARVLAKEGTFPAKAKIDTGAIKNVPVPLEKVEGADSRYRIELTAVLKLIARLKLVAEDTGDSASVAPAAEKAPWWRIIVESASHDGAYALAWGQKGQAVPKGQLDEEGLMSVSYDDPSLVNLVVNVSTGKVLGTTRAKHFGDKARYNHTECVAAWSGDDRFVAQVSQAKWGTTDAYVYEVKGTSLTAGADLKLAAIGAVHAQLKGRRHIDELAWQRLVFGLGNVEFIPTWGAWRLKMEVSGEVPKTADAPGVTATVIFKLAPGKEGGAPVLSVESAHVQ